MAKVFCGIPTYGGVIAKDIPFRMMQSSKDHTVMYSNSESSACTMTFNLLLLQALEERKRGNADFFLLWHSDIVPENYFIDKMVKIAQEKKAEVLACIVPIKDEKGLTSTALDIPVGDVPLKWRPQRLTMREIMKLEPTFTHDKLLVNTGLLLIDLSVPWINDIYFHFEDCIIPWHGQRLPVLVPEDWMFSRDARALGCKSMWVTREVSLVHMGTTQFPNNVVWGTMETDAAPPTAPDIMAACTEASKIQGWMSWSELAYLADRAKSAKCIVELGSWRGRSSKAMALVTKGKLHCVDSWRGSTNGDATATISEAEGRDSIKGEFMDNLVSCHEHVTAYDCEHAFAGQTLRGLEGEVDFCFIDGDHAFEHIRRDILTCMDLMAPGAILAGHDFNEVGVAKAVQELLPGFKLVAGTSIWEYRIPALVEAPV